MGSTPASCSSQTRSHISGLVGMLAVVHKEWRKIRTLESPNGIVLSRPS